jgi:hypothetical protein
MVVLLGPGIALQGRKASEQMKRIALLVHSIDVRPSLNAPVRSFSEGSPFGMRIPVLAPAALSIEATVIP